MSLTELRVKVVKLVVRIKQIIFPHSFKYTGNQWFLNFISCKTIYSKTILNIKQTKSVLLI